MFVLSVNKLKLKLAVNSSLVGNVCNYRRDSRKQRKMKPGTFTILDSIQEPAPLLYDLLFAF